MDISMPLTVAPWVCSGAWESQGGTCTLPPIAIALPATQLPLNHNHHHSNGHISTQQ